MKLFQFTKQHAILPVYIRTVNNLCKGSASIDTKRKIELFKTRWQISSDHTATAVTYSYRLENWIESDNLAATQSGNICTGYIRNELFDWIIETQFNGYYIFLIDMQIRIHTVFDVDRNIAVTFRAPNRHKSTPKMGIFWQFFPFFTFKIYYNRL